MKKLLLIVASVAIVTSSYAQPKKGDWMVGFNIFPQTFKAGKLLSNNFLLGVSLNAGFSQGIGVKQTYAFLTISPSLRYYFCAKEGLSANKFNFFADANFDISGNLTHNNTGKLAISKNYLGAGIGPGLQYMITDRVSTEGMMRLNYRGIGQPGNDQVATTFEIGLQVYLKGKNKKASDITEMRGS